MTATIDRGTKVEWRIVAEELASCNCDWGCPCQFNSLPSKGNCEALVALDIKEGHFGSTKLDGARFAAAYHWPGPVHEGKGTRLLVLDERTTLDQRAAIKELVSGRHGHPFFEIFASVTETNLEPVVKEVRLEYDREARTGSIRIDGVGETRIEPIKNPVTGDEHRVRIDLPNGFEFRQAEVGNSVSWRVSAGAPLELKNENTYAQFARVEWASDGSTK